MATSAPPKHLPSYKPTLRSLKQGDQGADVRAVQLFLVGAGLYQGAADAVYGPKTTAAVKAYQTRHGLDADGWIGNQTWGSMISAGFVAVSEPTHLEPYPAEPDWMRPLPSNEACNARWGLIQTRPAHDSKDPEALIITNDFEDRCIVRAVCPATGKKVALHKDVMPDYLAAMQAVVDAGLRDRILTFDGAFVPRYQRGSRSALSRHAWGSAFDINCDYNPLGRRPARPGQKGCVYELVPIFNKHHFWWGGHFKDPRKDGMHFEHV